MRKIEASDKELQILGNLLDAAVRYSGLPIAEHVVLWKRKIETSEEVKDDPDIKTGEN